jgi:hypothetical protein
MARCTAPVEGHRSSSAAAACPACRYKSGRYGGGGYGGGYSRPYSEPTYTQSYTPSYSSGGGGGAGSRSSRSTKPRWSSAGSAQFYTPEEVRALTPIRETVERRASLPDLRHIFLCHAWDDRQASAKELYDLLIARGVTVWFSEADIKLGEPFIRHRQRLGKVARRDCARDPFAVDAASGSERRRQGAFGSPTARSARADHP